MLYIAPWKMAITILVVVLGFLLCLPNFFTAQQLGRLPDWVPVRQITLGLDLQGGAHLLFEVDTSSVVKDRLEQVEIGRAHV